MDIYSEYMINNRLFIAELITLSNKIPQETIKNILIEYNDKKIINIINQLDDLNNNNLQEFIGLMIVGGIAFYNYLKTKSEKIKEKVLLDDIYQCNELKKSDAKKSCLKKLKIQSYQKQIDYLRNNIVSCDKIKDPDRCKSLVNLEIQKISKKLPI